MVHDAGCFVAWKRGATAFRYSKVQRHTIKLRTPGWGTGWNDEVEMHDIFVGGPLENQLMLKGNPP